LLSRRPTFNSLFETLATHRLSVMDNSFFFDDADHHEEPQSGGHVSTGSGDPDTPAAQTPLTPDSSIEEAAREARVRSISVKLSREERQQQGSSFGMESNPLAANPLGSQFPTQPLMQTLLDHTLLENNLESCIPIFREAEVDLDAFLLLTDEDMHELGIKAGTRKKLFVVSQALQTMIDDMGGSETQKQLNIMLASMRQQNPKPLTKKKKKKPAAKEGEEDGKKKKKKKKTKDDGSQDDGEKKKKKKKKAPKEDEDKEKDQDKDKSWQETEQDQKAKEENFMRSIFAKMEMHASDEDSDEDDELNPEPGFEEKKVATVPMPTVANSDTGRNHKIKKMPNLPPATIRDPQMKGWLLKQGGSVRSWKKRWVVLKDRCLYYYEEPADAKPKGMFLLPSYEIQLAQTELKRDFAFRAYHPTARTYYFVANNTAVMEKWIKALKEAATI